MEDHWFPILFSHASNHGIISQKINLLVQQQGPQVLPPQHSSHIVSPGGREAQVTDQGEVVGGVGYAGQGLVTGHLLVAGQRNHLIHLQDTHWD